MDKVAWGIISTAKIGVEKVIPGMQRGRFCDVKGIASRDEARAQEAASALGIANAYGSYEALLADPDIEAVYNPLPNHLHVPWTVKALDAGKHVLCEKPMGMTVLDVQALIEASKRHRNLKLMEAFMYRFHPQWVAAKTLATNGTLGQLKTVQTFFSYFNTDPENIRNIAKAGGGALMDIGCYGISLSRFIVGEGGRVGLGGFGGDQQFGTDRTVSATLEVPKGNATFTCGTQLSPYQRVHIVGTEGRIEIEIPFNAPPDRPCRLWLQRGSEIEERTFKIVDQYTLQGDLFSEAIRQDKAVPTPLTDAVNNMKVIDALRKSHAERRWESL